MCRSCDMEADLDTLPFVERFYVGEHWRLSHAWSSLPGWVVVSLRRHAVALHELTPEETAEMGRIVQTVGVTLRALVGCEKEYVMLFAEHPDFHLHLHVVPRMPWFTPDDLAGNVFRFVNVPEDEQVPTAERERVASALREALCSGTMTA